MGTQVVSLITVTAGEDMKAYEIGMALTMNTTGRWVATDAATDVIMGFLAERPDRDVDTTGDAIVVSDIAAGGIHYCILAADQSTRGIVVATTTDGKVGVVATIGDLAVDQQGAGYLEETGSADERVLVKAHVFAAPHSV